MQCQRELKYFLDVFVLIVRSISYVILPYYGNVPVVQLKVPNVDPTTAGCPHAQAHVIEIILTPILGVVKLGSNCVAPHVVTTMAYLRCFVIIAPTIEICDFFTLFLLHH